MKRQSVLIDGSRGVGKSSTLTLAVQHFKENGALVLATRGEEFLRDRFGQISVSKVKPGVLDQACGTTAPHYHRHCYNRHGCRYCHCHCHCRA